MLLFLDTSDHETTTLVLIGKEKIVKRTWKSFGKLSETLVLEIEKLLKKNKVNPAKLTKLGVVIGPGHFSRVRTGVATANALAFALNIPVVGIKKLGAELDYTQVLQQKGEKSVLPFYDKEPNITKAKSKKLNF